ncbi:MAG: hypothetical protein NTV24_02500 [Candidatus Woesebacteria bacterium]|nr:hypothetical protein [Candidatus Woesebacteria bacterium]
MRIENPKIILGGRGEIPSWGIIDSLFGDIQYKVHILGPQIQTAINERCREERKKKREFIIDSDSVPLGHKNKLDQMFKTSTKSGLENPRYRNTIYQAEGNHANPKKCKWGKDRKRMAEEIKRMTEQKWTQEDIVNSVFAQAEESDRRSSWKRR